MFEKFIDAVVENLERRFPDIAELDAFRVFNPQTWPDEDVEQFVTEEIEVGYSCSTSTTSPLSMIRIT